MALITLMSVRFAVRSLHGKTICMGVASNDALTHVRPKKFRNSSFFTIAWRTNLIVNDAKITLSTSQSSRIQVRPCLYMYMCINFSLAPSALAIYALKISLKRREKRQIFIYACGAPKKWSTFWTLVVLPPPSGKISASMRARAACKKI